MTLKKLEKLCERFFLLLFSTWTLFFTWVLVRHGLNGFDTTLSRFGGFNFVQFFYQASMNANYFLPVKDIQVPVVNNTENFTISMHAVKGLKQSLLGFDSSTIIVPKINEMDNTIIAKLLELDIKQESKKSWFSYFLLWFYPEDSVRLGFFVQNLLMNNNLSREEFASCLKLLYYASKVFTAIASINTHLEIYREGNISMSLIFEVCPETWVVSLCFCKEFLDLMNCFFDTSGLKLDFYYEHSYSLTELGLDTEGDYNFFKKFEEIKKI